MLLIIVEPYECDLLFVHIHSTSLLSVAIFLRWISLLFSISASFTPISGNKKNSDLHRIRVIMLNAFISKFNRIIFFINMK